MERKGAALKYDTGDNAPSVIARARGDVLSVMVRLAEKDGITVYRDPDLAEMLCLVEEGSEIPSELYAAVAEIIAYCWKINGKLKREGVL